MAGAKEVDFYFMKALEWGVSFYEARELIEANMLALSRARAKLAKEREQAKPARYFVIEGSRAWDPWVAEMRRRTGFPAWSLTTWGLVNGKQCRGWYFPSDVPRGLRSIDYRGCY